MAACVHPGPRGYQVGVCGNYRPIVLDGSMKDSVVAGASKPQSSTCTASWPAARNRAATRGERWHRPAVSTRSRKRQLSFLCSCRRPFEGTEYVLADKVRVVLKDLFDCPAGC